MELYARVRRACHVDGMSRREAARVFGIDRKTVDKMLEHSVPPGYRRGKPVRRPKLDPYTAIIDAILKRIRLGRASSAIRPSGSSSGYAMSMALMAASLSSRTTCASTDSTHKRCSYR